MWTLFIFMSREEYIAEFDELHLLASDLMTMGADEAVTAVEDLLIHAYLMGRRHTCEDLDIDEGDMAYFESLMAERASAQRMSDTISKEFAGKDFADRVREYWALGDIAALQRVIETEYHRDYNAGGEDLATDYRKRYPSSAVYKQWQTMEDDRVRATHDPLDYVRVRVGDEFHTWDGDHAPYPGAFTKVENNVNCRCWLTYSAS